MSSSTVKESNRYKPAATRDAVFLLRAQGLGIDIREELEERIDPDDNERCLIFSDFADAIEEFIACVKRLGGTP